MSRKDKELQEAYEQHVTRLNNGQRQTHDMREIDRSGIEGDSFITGNQHQANLVRKQQMLMSDQQKNDEQEIEEGDKKDKPKSKEDEEKEKNENNKSFMNRLINMRAKPEGIQKARGTFDGSDKIQGLIDDMEAGKDPQKSLTERNLKPGAMAAVTSSILREQTKLDSGYDPKKDGFNSEALEAKRLSELYGREIKEEDVDDGFYLNWIRKHGIQEGDSDEPIVFRD